MSDRFNGTWTIDLDVSVVWDGTLKRHVKDEVGQEIITLRVSEGVQDYEVLYGDRPRIRMGYTARYDDSEWVQYSVREVLSTSQDAHYEMTQFKQRIKAIGGDRERSFNVGESYGVVRLVWVDEMTHYRVSRSPQDGRAQSIMLRRMAEDGRSYLATVLDVQGIVYRIRKFVRLAY